MNSFTLDDISVGLTQSFDTSVSPSMIDTKFLNTINEKFVELNAYNHPLKRNAQVDDVTPVIKMLLSSDADYINGVNIPITAGSIF